MTRPQTIREMIETYLDQRRGSVAESTIESHYYRLRLWAEWCEDQDIELDDLESHHVHQYLVHRRDEAEVRPATLRHEINTIASCLRIAAAVDVVEPELPELVHDLIPSVSRNQETSRESMDPDRAEETLEWFRTYQYASRDHVILEIIWQTGARAGDLVALDVGDVNRERDCLEIRHRPQTDTPVKNGRDGERNLAAGEEIAGILDEPPLIEIVVDYLEGTRIRTQDEYGRRPLISSEAGRMGVDALRGVAYRITRPCYTVGYCPHDKDPETCEWVEYRRHSKCPSAKSTHPIRGASIEMQRDAGLPIDLVSDRVNATREVIEQHYDHRGPADRLESRRERIGGLS